MCNWSESIIERERKQARIEARIEARKEARIEARIEALEGMITVYIIREAKPEGLFRYFEDHGIEVECFAQGDLSYSGVSIEESYGS